MTRTKQLRLINASTYLLRVQVIDTHEQRIGACVTIREGRISAYHEIEYTTTKIFKYSTTSTRTYAVHL